MPVRFNAILEHEVYDEDPCFGLNWDSWLNIEGSERSASVFIHEVRTAGASFGKSADGLIDWEQLTGGNHVEPLTDNLPKRLGIGETMIFRNPWERYTPTPAAYAWAKVRIYYSVERDSQRHNLEIAVDIPAASQNNRQN